jgi:hypothetical protein
MMSLVVSTNSSVTHFKSTLISEDTNTHHGSIITKSSVIEGLEAGSVEKNKNML